MALEIILLYQHLKQPKNEIYRSLKPKHIVGRISFVYTKFLNCRHSSLGIIIQATFHRNRGANFIDLLTKMNGCISQNFEVIDRYQKFHSI